MATPASHALTLSMTNSYGYVAVCACGWSGAVHPSYVEVGASGKKRGRNYDEAQRCAAAEHHHHVVHDTPSRVTPAPENFTGTVLQPGRFGHA
jgi:hypothetical protein